MQKFTFLKKRGAFNQETMVNIGNIHESVAMREISF